MTLFRTILNVFSAFVLCSSCARHSGPAPLNLEDASVQWAAPDSSEEEGILSQQRALAIYILSLSPKERAEWVSGTFTENELSTFVDSLQTKPK
ncbi:MAG: hypothetical protein ACKO4Y_00200 [Flavobacteriales bacterium]